MTREQSLRFLRKRYHWTVVGHPSGLDTARRLAVFIGCCFKYRVEPSDMWVLPRDLANDLLVNLRKAKMTEQFEYAKEKIFDYYNRFRYLCFTDLWDMVNHIFPEVTYERLNIMSSYKQITGPRE